MTLIKKYTLQEVYDSSVWRVDEGKDVHYLLSLLQVNTYANLKNQTRIKVKSHGIQCENLCVKSVWLDDKPLMVVVNSYDIDSNYEKVYISDIHTYIELRTYLMSFVNTPYEVVQVNEPMLEVIGNYYVQEILQ